MTPLSYHSSNLSLIALENMRLLVLNKFTISGDIPTKILKQHAQIYSKKQADIFNESIKMGKFPDILNRAEVTPAYKKDEMNDKQISSGEYIIQSIKCI